jgi:hypothetical protein
MALTELQLPPRSTFYGRLQAAATEMDRVMTQWASLAEFVAEVETADLDAMNVAAGQVRTDLVDFRVMMEEVVAFYQGTPTTATIAPDVVVDKIRSM